MGKTAVILKQNHEKLGLAGDLVSVSSGYARNFLLPRNLCVLAGKEELAALEIRKEQIRKKSQKDRDQLSVVAQKVNDLVLRVPVRVGEGGKVFGSVTAMHISKLLLSHGITVDKKNLHLEHPIKETGLHTAVVNLGHSLHAALRVDVVSE